MSVEPKVVEVCWPEATRIISSIYPPIHLFEDCADPEDWELLVMLESRSNPRLMEDVGQLAKVPVERRVSGPGASYVMAPFVHVHPSRAGRFHDGHFGAYYAADRLETALAETMFHRAHFYRASGQAPGWFSQYRELVGRVEARLHRLESVPPGEYLRPDLDYGASQSLARSLREAGSDGLCYPSVRDPKGHCIAAFWPNVVEIPKQGRHFAYHFDGERISYYRDETSRQVFRCVE